MICRSPVLPGEWPGASADAPFSRSELRSYLLLLGNGLLLRSNPPSWMTMRTLRNQMVHEYVEDPAVLHSALQTGHSFVQELLAAANKMIAEIERRGWA